MFCYLFSDPEVKTCRDAFGILMNPSSSSSSSSVPIKVVKKWAKPGSLRSYWWDSPRPLPVFLSDNSHSQCSCLISFHYRVPFASSPQFPGYPFISACKQSLTDSKHNGRYGGMSNPRFVKPIFRALKRIPERESTCKLDVKTMHTFMRDAAI